MKTKNAAHTPGPWDVYAGKTRGLDRIIVDEKNNQIAHAIDLNEYQKDAEVDANARLIAAAPDLLAALKTSQENRMPGDVGYEASRAAIAKAEGL